MPDSWDYSSKPQREDAGAQIPFITYGLVALSVLITAAYLSAGDTPGTQWYQLGHFGHKEAFEIWDGGYYGLLTSFFIHLSIWHLLFNMMWLTRLGKVLEFTLNPLVYILFMASATIVGSCAELAVSGQTGSGASGAVYAMFGLLWAGRGCKSEWRNVATRENLNIFIGWAVLCIILTWTKILPVANAAHFGGFLYGLSIGWLFYAPRRQPLWAIPLALLGVICVLSLTWMPWSWQWAGWRGNREIAKKNYTRAIDWYQKSLNLGGDLDFNWHNTGVAWQGIADQERRLQHPEAEQKAEQEAEAAFEKARAAKGTVGPQEGTSTEEGTKFVPPGAALKKDETKSDAPKTKGP